MILETRSTIAPENYQEALDAEEGHEKNAALSGQQQYYTPAWATEQFEAVLRKHGLSTSPATVIDPQAGEGALLRIGSWGTERFAIDLDNRLAESGNGSLRRVTGNCVRAAEVLDDVWPELRFVCGVANPPFGKHWKLKDGTSIDSTAWTWKFLTDRCNYGYLISNTTTLQKLGIARHPWVVEYQEHFGGNIWKGVNITIGVAFWKRPEPDNYTPSYELRPIWEELGKILDEEKSQRPDFNIYLGSDGLLRTYLSQRLKIKRKLGYAEIQRLASINKQHPLTLTTDKETRDLLKELVEGGIYTVQPEAHKAITEALAAVASMACPIMPVTDFETVAYSDTEEALTCVQSICAGKLQFTAGKTYRLQTGTYRFTERFTRNKIHFNEESGETYTKPHDCTLTGQDRYISVNNDRGHTIRFMDRPPKCDAEDEPNRWQFEESRLWDIFQRPAVKTVADVSAAQLQQNIAVMKGLEMMAGYEYYPGQLQYLARLACKDNALAAGATGTGKTLFAISLLALKCPARALIIAPQGTMRSSSDADEDEDGRDYSASQWRKELERFAPYLRVWEIFSFADYARICAENNGTLPPGVYVSYPQAMFQNEGARETAPLSWDDHKLNKFCEANGFATFPVSEKDKRAACDTIGHEENGIRCILSPCLATRIGHLFDCVLLDEAHLMCHLGTNVTQMVIRLQPKYRYALTATPIPDVITNIFPIMGWLAVPDWFKGERRNPAFPYARHEEGRFKNAFMSEERDHTQEQDNLRRDPRWRGKCIKSSPIISSPARLLKILKPTMAYIGKKECNAKYEPPKIIDVRVPLGHQQAKLYGYFLDRSHIPGHPLVRARRQSAWLRGICADPAGFDHGPETRPRVQSNMNPKVIAILELVRDILARGEPVVIINSRLGLTQTLQDRLVEAGAAVSRIDSTIPAEQHSYQANLFKSGKTQLLLMGIRCASSHSFEHCPNNIIGSLEWSPGPFDQARGRTDRVNSRPGGRLYCILHKTSIEEVQYDCMMVKGDAAAICLMGQRVPRDYVPVDASEVLAEAFQRFDLSGATPEDECELAWPKLRDSLKSHLTR